MFDPDGKEIAITPEFIQDAQDYYIRALSARLQPAQAKKFSERIRQYCLLLATTTTVTQ
jgi:hypothetical protein